METKDLDQELQLSELADLTSSDSSSAPVFDNATPKKPSVRKKKPQKPAYVGAEVYVIRSSSGEEIFASEDFFDVRDKLKKEPAGTEMIRRSDGAKLSFNTRQKPPSDPVPTAPINYRKR